MIPRTLSEARKIIDSLKAKLISPKEITIMNMSGPRCLEIADKAKLEGRSVLSALVAEYKKEQDEIDAKGQAPSASACTPSATVLPTAARPATPARPTPPAATPQATRPAVATTAAPSAHARDIARAILDETEARRVASLTKSRAEFEKLTPAQASKFCRDGGKLTD
jgi:hypothetical protein